MAAATITTKLLSNDSGKENVVLTATDTNTYVSNKFLKVNGVKGTLMEDTASLSIPLSFGISANTVTINCTGLSSQKVFLTLYGNK